ncbi:MAG: hypothetical protein SFV15_07845 [Polyangiaceae bacterium]|nr:hypothetical protein [Polyangiaceae bacterium]
MSIGFVAVAVLLVPRPERTVTLSASSGDVNLSSIPNNEVPSANDRPSSGHQAQLARRGFRSAEPGRQAPAAPGYPAPGYAAMAPTPYSDSVPAQPRNLVARASYGMQNFAEVAKVKVTGESEVIGESEAVSPGGGTGAAAGLAQPASSAAAGAAP